MSLTEGSRVFYVGDGEDGLVPGDVGKILVRDGYASHVRWASGIRQGQILLVDDLDLVLAQKDANADDLDSGDLLGFPVQGTLNRYGREGLYETLSSEGHLAVMEPVLDEAFGMIAAHLRRDPSIQAVLSTLGEVEGEEFVIYTTYALLRDALREDDI